LTLTRRSRQALEGRRDQRRRVRRRSSWSVTPPPGPVAGQEMHTDAAAATSAASPTTPPTRRPSCEPFQRHHRLEDGEDEALRRRRVRAGPPLRPIGANTASVSMPSAVINASRRSCRCNDEPRLPGPARCAVPALAERDARLVDQALVVVAAAHVRADDHWRCVGNRADIRGLGGGVTVDDRFDLVRRLHALEMVIAAV
jgi:hypothetical protein